MENLENSKDCAALIYEHERAVAMLQSVIEDQKMQIEELKGLLDNSIEYIDLLKTSISKLQEDLAMEKAEKEEW